MEERILMNRFCKTIIYKMKQPNGKTCLRQADIAWKFSREVVLAVLYKVYLVRRVISLVDTVQYS